MSGAYGINPIGGLSAEDMAAFMQAYRYQPSFRANAEQQVSPELLAAYQQALNASPTQSATNTITQQQVQYTGPKKYAKEEDHTKLKVFSAAAAIAAVGYACYKGGGNPIKGAKTIWGSLKGAWNKFFSGASSDVTNQLKAIVDKDGKLSFIVPGKTISTSTQAEAENLAQQYGIKLEDLLKATKSNLKSVNGGKFMIDGNLVTFKGDKIIEILNKDGSNITDSILKKATVEDKAFATRIEDVISKARKMEKGWGKNFIETDFTHQIGDDIVNFTRTSQRNVASAGNPLQIEKLTAPKNVINKFTTLERLDINSDAVQNYFYHNPLAKEIFTSDKFKAGEYLKNTNIAKATIESGSKTFYFENGNVVGFSEGTAYYPKTHEKFGAYMSQGTNEADILKLYETTFKDNKVPTGASVILTAA